MGKHWNLTKETREKMRKNRTGKPAPNKGMKGRWHLSEDTKNKISKTRLEIKERVGYLNSPETRKKISQSNVGRESPRGMLGKNQTKESRLKISKNLSGEKSYLWRGGITPESQKIRESVEYRLWREAVFARDNWTCQHCKNPGGRIEAHHIKSFSKFPELRFAIDNGVTLHKKYHQKIHKNGRKPNNKNRSSQIQIG